MQIKALKALTIRVSESGDLLASENEEIGKLVSIAHGAIAEVPEAVGQSLIEDGLAEKVTEEAGFDAFKDLVKRTITNVTADMLGDISSIASYLFYNCDSLESIEIPNSVTRIWDWAFFHCISLRSIEIPAGVTLIGESAFSTCEGLKSVTVLATNPPSLGKNAFGYAGVQAVYVPSESVDTYKEASGWSYLASKIQAIPAEEGQS